MALKVRSYISDVCWSPSPTLDNKCQNSLVYLLVQLCMDLRPNFFSWFSEAWKYKILDLIRRFKPVLGDGKQIGTTQQDDAEYSSFQSVWIEGDSATSVNLSILLVEEVCNNLAVFVSCCTISKLECSTWNDRRGLDGRICIELLLRFEVNACRYCECIHYAV